MSLVIAIRGPICILGRSIADIDNNFIAAKCNIQQTHDDPFPFSNNIFTYILVNRIKRREISFAAGTRPNLPSKFHEALKAFMESTIADAEEYLNDIS